MALDAFERGVVDMIPALRGFARTLTRNPTLAEDLAQETLERALAKRHLYDGESALKPWLFRIMKNLNVERIRAEKRSNVALGDSQSEDGESVAGRDAHGAWVAIRDMQKLLDGLDADHRNVVMMVAVDEMSCEECARVAGVSVGTVKSRMSRARAKMRQAENAADAEFAVA